MAKKEWFEEWFGSPYYPILYKHRDESEALAFIEVLMQNLSLDAGAKVLDLACGRGRHAKYLSEYGLDVLGLDISGESIAEAKEMEHSHLHFAVHDMRNAFPAKGFQHIFNLFTSFGYFEHVGENEQVLANIYEALEAGGGLVLDYFNSDKVVKNLVREEEKEVDGVHFSIRRYVEEGSIYKRIEIRDGAHQELHTERVQALYLQDFEKLLNKVGFRVQNIWGSYTGEAFDRGESNRLILFAQKP